MLQMDQVGEVRDFSKVGDAAPVPNLIDIQLSSYGRFLQAETPPERRRSEGLEGLLREIFPIVSYDGRMSLQYLAYELGEARYDPQECRDLRLTYGRPFRIRCRLSRKDSKDVLEESIYVGEVPIMIGGGEFIINGAERVIVSQLHRSPGVDFTVEMQESDRPLHGARIIPERGSWIEMSVTKKDALTIRIDQSSKIPATMFLRSMDERFDTDADIIREFYPTKKLPVDKLRVTMYVVEPFVDPDTGEEILPAGGQIGEALTRMVSAPAKAGGASFEEIREAVKKLRSKVPLSLADVREVRKKHLTKPSPFEFAFVRTDRDPETGEVSPVVSKRTLNAIESQLIADYHPRLNVSLGTGSADDVKKADAYVQVIKRHVDQKGAWVQLDDLEKNADELPHLVSDENDTDTLEKTDGGPQGVYIFKPRGGSIKDGYIGVAGEEKSKDPKAPGLIQRLREHFWTGDWAGGKGTDVPFIEAIIADAVWRRVSSGDTVAKAVRACGLPSAFGEKLSARLEGRQSSGTVEVIERVTDPLMLNTLLEDPSESHENALLRIYMRLRPGNPPQADKAKTLFKEKFYDDNRYRLGKVGRFRINRKFKQGVDETEMTLRPEDFVNTLKYILHLRSGEGVVDDIDHLGNRRLRTIDELATDELRKGFLKLRRTVQERMSLKNPEELGKIAELVNSKSISSSIDYFFGRGELSQVVDTQNPLSQLTHERRLSALGPGGLNRKRAGFEVRDVHISHYGRICPIETPEGNNIGLISSLGIYAGVDEYGFLTTPYRQVVAGEVTSKIIQLRADEEMEGILAPPSTLGPGGKGKGTRLPKEHVLARVKGELGLVRGREVEYVDISPKQTVGVSASLIPFLEHDDANRALMGSNMQRQAVPLIRTEAPLVATGMERAVVENSGMVVRARKGGTVTFVDSQRIVIDNADEYPLRKFAKLNERTCLNQKPIVLEGQRVKKDQIIADGSGCDRGELALGRNLLVAFMPFDGYNFEDAILISQEIVKKDAFTSIHLEEYEVEIRETKLGREEFTRDIPNISERALRSLDADGIVCVGTRVEPGDILVGKVSPKSKSELSPEEKLLHAIFGRAGEDVKNDSLELPAGEEGVVVATRRFSRRMHMSEEQKKQLNRQMKQFREQTNERMVRVFRILANEVAEVLGSPMVDPSTRQKVGQSDIDAVILEQIENFSVKWIKTTKPVVRAQAMSLYEKYWPRVEEVQADLKRRLDHMKRGDELPTGVLEMVKVRVATKRRLGVGDKMAGRHGNKGVIARIVPREDMPFLEDGTPVDIVLNPLGVPGRMNLGQILETHLGWAAAVLGFKAVTPVFDGATEQEIFQCLREANQHVKRRCEDLLVVQEAGESGELLVAVPEDGKIRLYDGRTGEPFEQKVAVGYIYMNKLHHLVDEKIHARATGPYSLITQQPLGGKARTGGQRFGEMEVWGLEAYGASYTLQELLTVKSDDVEGRTKIYESMVKGTNTLEAGTPVSFDVLCNELRGLGLNILLEKKRLI